MKPRRAAASLLAASALLASGCKNEPKGATAEPSASASASAAPSARPLGAYVPAKEELDPAKIELGRLLFFDPRLSGTGTMSCATCHDPKLGFADGKKTGTGNGGNTLLRNTPSLVNVEARLPLFWDGRAKTVEEQAMMPVTNPEEMAHDLEKLVAELASIPEYLARFKRAFKDAKIDKERIAEALAAFERTIVSAASPFDRFMAGEPSAMSAKAKLGMTLFTGKAECNKCHDGEHFTDASFHNIGIGGADPGRFAVLDLPVLKGAFKTPTLRDVELTAPYFHDGSAATLADVVAHYDKGGATKENLDPDIRPLGLSAVEQEALVEFMKALTGKVVPPVRPRIPVVVTKPSFRSTRDLMRRTDGMLQQLDKMIAHVDKKEWGTVREAVDTLIRDTEELAALRVRTTKDDRKEELRLLLGELIVDFGDLDASAARGDTSATSTIYDTVRARCEQCHDAFRYAPKKPGR